MRRATVLPSPLRSGCLFIGMDCTDCLNRKRVCPNAPQLYYLGWADIVPRGDLNGTVLQPGVRMNLTVRAGRQSQLEVLATSWAGECLLS